MVGSNGSSLSHCQQAAHLLVGPVSISEIEPASPRNSESSATVLMQLATDYYERTAAYVRENSGTVAALALFGGAAACVLFANTRRH